jgi:8-amino-7-oxononanoate synthase
MNKQGRAFSPWAAEIEELRQKDLFRIMPAISGPPGRIILVDGREALNFSSNNYLGLAAHPEVVQTSVAYAREYGAGSTASRLIAGNGEAHRELETAVARWKGTEAALLFVSGYQANVGTISAVTGSQDLLISDQLNHASIIDGCRLSRAKVEVYPHLDLNRLEDLLRLTGFRRKLVVTESVFSMDGHCAPLREIHALCQTWGALLMVDEAHGTGVFGPNGQGLAAELGVVPEVQMGTLGKAAGVAGAYVAGSRSLIEILVNKARPLIYTTAAPPAVLGAARAALRIIASEEGRQRRERLHDNMKYFADLLQRELDCHTGGAHIVPILVGQSARALRVSRACLEEGLFAQGIRYPTVPEGTARLRLTLMSDHTSEDLRKAVSVMAAALAEDRSQAHPRMAVPRSR